MSDIVIKAEGIGKSYLVGHRSNEKYVALRDVIVNKITGCWSKICIPKSYINKDIEEFWALKDISFEIKKGESVGIIGRNGAGKSTLLKILSRITEPTLGRISIQGRVASLLEVGTGFHQELTGRENIYLNGAILGMTRLEIKRKFDEIVSFAEVEKFLDTPVKHYSSGMYVRLAFAVAAHLEPEILVVDEVLAVGDAQFQKKCLGKMNEISQQGRTVLFVSHNMGAIQQLCEKAILLKSGELSAFSQVNDIVKLYLKNIFTKTELSPRAFIGTLTQIIEFKEIKINDFKLTENIIISPSSRIRIMVNGNCKKDLPFFRITFSIFREGVRLVTLHDVLEPTLLPKGAYESEIEIPAFFLRPGEYSIAIGGYRDGMNEWIWGVDLATFVITEEWSINNDPINSGMVNLSHKGMRKFIDDGN